MQWEGLPQFDNPPVIETILGAQFDPITGFTSAHFGWYWREFLENTWSKTHGEPGLPDQFERFGTMAWTPRQLTAFIGTGAIPERVQFVNRDDDRVIQVQQSRFLYNWRKRESIYPKFEDLRPEFDRQLQGFRNFLRKAELGELVLNQKELPISITSLGANSGILLEDWHRILPGLIPSPRGTDEARLETESGELHFEIVPERGRLHVTINHGKLQTGETELLIIQLTARGPVVPDQPHWDLPAGLDLGHSILVRTFASLASDSALSHWGARST